jgi:hypothetical protein
MGCQNATKYVEFAPLVLRTPSPAKRPQELSTDFITDSRIKTDASAKMKNGLGRNVNAGLKPLAQYVEALRANERVGFIRLS